MRKIANEIKIEVTHNIIDGVWEVIMWEDCMYSRIFMKSEKKQDVVNGLNVLRELLHNCDLSIKEAI